MNNLNMNDIKITEKIPIEILDDLSSRFIINLPHDERGEIIRVMFQIELAHWFYIDFFCVNNLKLNKYHIKVFAKLMFKHVPFLQQYLETFDQNFDKWRKYKLSVPTFGAILLDETLENVLMVQGYNKISWGFPKGKINAEESPLACACREVKEEIGFDCKDLIKENEYIETYIRETYVRLYIITGVKKNKRFEPRTRNEIKKIQWFSLKDIPTNKNEKDLNRSIFFFIIPIIKLLKKWIYEHQIQKNRNKRYDNSRKECIKYSPLFKQAECNYFNRISLQEQSTKLNNNNIKKVINIKKQLNTEKITVLKNFNLTGDNYINLVKLPDAKFFSYSLANFTIDLEKLWKDCIIAS